MKWKSSRIVIAPRNAPMKTFKKKKPLILCMNAVLEIPKLTDINKLNIDNLFLLMTTVYIDLRGSGVYTLVSPQKSPI